MSDLGASPYPYGSPEDKEFMRGQMRGFALPITHAPIGAATQLTTNLDAPGLEKLVPGMASGLYSTVDTVQGLAQHYIGGVPAGQVTHIPGGEEAGRLYDQSREKMAALIPHMQPQNPVEERIAGAGETAGAMGLALPEGLAAGLPRVARGVASVLAPGPKAILPSIAIGEGAQTLIDNAQAAPTPATPPSTQQAQQATPTSTPLFPQAQAQPVQPLFPQPAQPQRELPQPLFPPPPQVQGATPLFAQHGDKPVTEAEQDPTTISDTTALFAAGAMVAALWARPHAMKFARGLGEARFFAENDRINTAAAANGGQVTSEVPLPGTTGTTGTKIRQYSVDSGAIAKEYLKSTADTPLIGERLQYKYGDMTQDQAVTQRYMYGTQAGELHGQKMPPLYDWYQDHAKLTPEQKDLLNTGMNYGNELDNRRANAFLTTEPERRVNFAHLDEGALQQGLADAHADPQVKALMDEHRMQTDAFVDMMFRNNQISANEQARLKAAHRNFVPSTDLDNIITNPMNTRNITPYSGNAKLADFSQIKDQHAFALYKMVEDNNARDLIISNALDYQGKELTPGVKPAELFQPSKNPTTGEWVPKSDGSSIAVRRNGELQHYVVNNKALLNAMNSSTKQLGTGLTAWSKLKKLSESGMTGVLSVATGHVFPAINAMRSAGEITILRKSGMYGGFIDKGLQKATGGKVAFRGDPTAYLGTAYHAFADPAAETTRWLGELFAPKAPNAVNTRMRAVFGNSTFDAISKRAIAVYDQSNRAAMREQGMLSSAGMTANDVTSRTSFGKDFLKGDGKGAMMPSFDMVPENFQMNNLAGMAPTYVRLKNLFNEIRGSIGDAGHSNFFGLNRDNATITPEQLRYETRNATGDPGTHGAHKGILDAIVPFRNVAKQEGARVLRSLNEEAGKSQLGFMLHMGSMAAASLFTAMLTGPEAIQHLFDQTTDQQRSTNAHFYVPGYPEAPIKLPIQINMRAPYNFLLQMLHDVFSLPSHVDDPDWASRVMHWFADLHSKHVWQSTLGGMVEGLSGGIPPNIPAGVNGAGVALLGKTVDPTLAALYKNWNKPISQKFSYDVTGLNGSRVPGAAPGRLDPITNTVDGGLFGHLFSDVLATAGGLMRDAAYDYANVKHAGGTASDSFSHLMENYKMRVADSVPGLNTLWNIPDKLSASTPLQEAVEGRLDKMRGLTTWKNDMKAVGYTRLHGPQLAEPVTDPNTPADPTMKAMYVTAGKYMELLESKVGSPLKAAQDDRKQINSLERSPMSPLELRKAKNGYINDMQDQYVKTMAILHKMNGDLSNIAGKQVDIKDIDWKKGVEQFTRQGRN